MFYTDDPVKDFERHDQKQAQWLASRPVCGCCGQPIQDDHCYENGGKDICPDCIESYFRKEIDDYGE